MRGLAVPCTFALLGASNLRCCSPGLRGSHDCGWEQDNEDHGQSEVAASGGLHQGRPPLREDGLPSGQAQPLGGPDDAMGFSFAGQAARLPGFTVNARLPGDEGAPAPRKSSQVLPPVPWPPSPFQQAASDLCLSPQRGRSSQPSPAPQRTPQQRPLSGPPSVQQYSQYREHAEVSAAQLAQAPRPESASAVEQTFEFNARGMGWGTAGVAYPEREVRVRAPGGAWGTAHSAPAYELLRDVGTPVGPGTPLVGADTPGLPWPVNGDSAGRRPGDVPMLPSRKSALRLPALCSRCTGLRLHVRLRRVCKRPQVFFTCLLDAVPYEHASSFSAKSHLNTPLSRSAYARGGAWVFIWRCSWLAWRASQQEVTSRSLHARWAGPWGGAFPQSRWRQSRRAFTSLLECCWACRMTCEAVRFWGHNVAQLAVSILLLGPWFRLPEKPDLARMFDSRWSGLAGWQAGAGVAEGMGGAGFQRAEVRDTGLRRLNSATCIIGAGPVTAARAPPPFPSRVCTSLGFQLPESSLTLAVTILRCLDFHTTHQARSCVYLTSPRQHSAPCIG